MTRMLANHIRIDVQGALQIKGNFPAKLIFVSPPSTEALRERLNNRRTESPEALDKRLKRATEEMKSAKDYDYQIINDDFGTAYNVLRSIVIAEAHTPASNPKDLLG